MLKREITGKTNFEDLILQIEDAVENVAAQAPYTDKQNVAAGVAIVSKCGYYADDVRDWNGKAETEKTWLNYKKHFRVAFREARKNKSNTKHPDLVNLAEKMDESLQLIQEHRQQELTNFAATTTQDKKTIATLHNQVEKLARELGAANKNIANILGQLQNKETIFKPAGDKENSPPTNRQPLGERKPKKHIQRPPEAYDPKSYCWSCGYKVLWGHNSKTCFHKKTGHQDNTTRENPMNGSERHKGWPM
jgi:hypothetical protein